MNNNDSIVMQDEALLTEALSLNGLGNNGQFRMPRGLMRPGMSRQQILQAVKNVKPIRATSVDFIKERYRDPKDAAIVDHTFHHYQDYATAGLGSPLKYFQVKGANKEVCNMEDVGQMASKVFFILEELAVDYIPGGNTGAVTAIADLHNVMNRGLLEFRKNNNHMLEVYPLKRMPFPNAIEGEIYDDDASDDAGGGSISASLARVTGRPYKLHTPILLEPGENFEVIVSQPNGPVTVAAQGSLGVHLIGKKVTV